MLEKYVKCDPHVHTGGISTCCPELYPSVIDKKVAQGYQMAVLTNHSQSWYCSPDKHKEFMERHLEEFTHASAYAKDKGLTLLLGLEVTVKNPSWTDWLLYGVTERFMLNAPCLYQLTQKELFEYCKINGVIMIQAHPFRYHPQNANPAYTHGIEINCSSGDLQYKDESLRMASECSLMVTCGTDFHGSNPFHGGLYVPEWVKTGRDLGDYLSKTEKTSIFFGTEDIEIPAPKHTEEKYGIAYPAREK
jgi:hypothetical protein